MFRTETTSVRILQTVTLLTSLAVLMWSAGLTPFNLAEAASLTDVKNTLSDSDVSAVSDHTIEYVIPAGSEGVEATETIVVTFPAGFVMGSVDDTDIDLAIDGADQTLAAAPSGATWGAVVSGQDLTLTSGSGTAGANATVTISVGLNAAGGDAQVTNPTAGSYEFTIVSGSAGGVGGSDTGATRVAILDNVDVTASVDTIFNFTVGGFASAGIDTNGTTTTATTTATAIPFGSLSANVIETAAQSLNVSTNASQGFIVTVQQDGNLTSATGADIDGFVDGSYTDTPTSWTAPTPVLGTEDTYGHWGITSADTENYSGGSQFTSDTWVAASTTPRAVFGHDGPADGVTDEIGSTTVGYQIEISALQEAGDDYSATLTYVATPVF